jgi:WD40 repeat protein
MSARLGQADCDPHGKWLAVVDVWQKGIVLNLEDPARPTLLLGHDHVSNIALSPDGRWAATGTFKGADVKVWDLLQGNRPKPVHTIASAGAGVRFSPDGRWLVVGDSGRLRFFKVGSWELDPVMSGIRQGVGDMVVAADSSLIAVASGGKQVELIASATGRELATLMLQDSRTMIVPRAFSADGCQLAVTTSGHAIQLWNLRAVRRQLAEMGLDWDLPPYPPTGADTLRPSLSLEIEGPIPGLAPRASSDISSAALHARLALSTLIEPCFHQQRQHWFAIK